MGGKSSPAPAAPPPPNYAAAAQQTAQGNYEAAQAAQYANMVNQVSPDGTVTYTPKNVGSTSLGPLVQWTQSVNLSPAQQAMYNQNQAINQQLGNIAQSGVGYVQSAMNNPLAAQPIQRGVAETGQNFTTNVSAPDLQKSIANNADQLKTNIGDPNLLLQNTTDALYKANTQYLDPQFAQGQSDLQNKLANQGITQGSAAYDRAMLNFNNQKQQAYDSARNNAIAGGMNAAQGMFGMNAQNANLNNAALGQAYQQNLGAGNFANQAALGQFGMGQQNAGLNNAAQQNIFGQNVAAGNFANQATNQAFGQAQTLQQNPINMLNAVRTGQQMQVANIPQTAVSAPGQMATTSGADMLGASQALGNYNMNAYQAQLQANAAQQAQSSNAMSGIAGLGMAAIGMM